MMTRHGKGRHVFFPVMSILLVVLLFSQCSSKEEKRDAFVKKGTALLQQGETKKAILEFRNALQLDPNYAEGYFHLGTALLKDGDIRGGFSGFAKALELDENYDAARLEIGRPAGERKSGAKSP